MSLLQRFLALICLVLLFVFCVSNREPMIVRFLSWESTELPAFLLLIFAFLTGVMLALIWQSLRSVSRKSDKKDRPARKFGRKKKEELPTLDTSAETTVAVAEAKTGQPESAAITSEGEK